MENELVKVAASSNPGKVAGYLAHLFKENPVRIVEVRSVGKRAGEIATKAVTFASTYLDGVVDLVSQPKITTVQIEGEDREAVSLLVSDRYTVF